MEIEYHTISPIKVTRNAPGVSHLLFAYDSLLFFKADQMQATQTKQVLEKFCRGTASLLILQNPLLCVRFNVGQAHILSN